MLLDPQATCLQELAFHAVIATDSAVVRRREGYGLRLLAVELL